MTRWGDHWSSDEEDDMPERFEVKTETPVDVKAEAPPAAAPTPAAPPAAARPKKEFQFPSEPPFTAYVGNLVFSITDPQELSSELTNLVQTQLQATIEITDARIMMDHRNLNHDDKPKHRGFAYVQVATVDQLKTLMELNNVKLAGRPLHLDTASDKKQQQRRRNNNKDNFDGSKFRGGKFPSTTSAGGGGGQRPSLKLQPRSKPLANDKNKPTTSEGGSSRNDIFGGAKANDTGSWRSSRKPEEKNTTKKKPPPRKPKKQQPPAAKPVPPAAKPVPPPAAETETKKPEKKVTNSFAALGLSDSDDDGSD